MHVMKRCETDEDPKLAHAYKQLKICLEALHTLKLEHTWKFTLVNKNGIMRRRETKMKMYLNSILNVSRPSRTTTPHLMVVAISQRSISQFKWQHAFMFLLVSFNVTRAMTWQLGFVCAMWCVTRCCMNRDSCEHCAAFFLV